MVAERTSATLEIGWSDRALEVRVDVGTDGVPRLSRLAPIPTGDFALPADGAPRCLGSTQAAACPSST